MSLGSLYSPWSKVTGKTVRVGVLVREIKVHINRHDQIKWGCEW